MTPSPPRVDDFTADEIKAALRRCRTCAEVLATQAHFAADIRALYQDKDPLRRTQAIQIVNLIKTRRKELFRP